MTSPLSVLQNLNPVLDRELRQRSRSGKSVVVTTFFLSLLAAVLYLVYLGETNNRGFNGVEALTVTTGRSMFEWVLAAELLILLFIIPGVSAGAISGERDRQTLLPLQVTMMGRWGIFLGKVASSSSFVLLLLVASFPILAVPYLLGGVSLSQVLLSLLVMILTGITFAFVGVACSCIFKRTATATLMTYGVVLSATIGTLILFAITAIIDSARGDDFVEPRLWPLYPNPFVGVADAAGDVFSDTGSGPFSPIKEGFADNRRAEGIFDRNDGPLVPVWVRSLATQIFFAGLLTWWGIRKLTLPAREVD